MKKIFRIIAGVFCIIIGIIGLILPLLWGIPFIILGGTLLEWEWIKKLIKKIKKKLK